MKKIIIIVAVVVVVAGAAVYWFVLRDTETPEVRVSVPLESFTTNINGSPGKYLKTTVVIVVNDDSKEFTEMLTEQTPRIRDAIVFILRDLTAEQIEESGTKDALREMIITRVNTNLGIDNVVEVLFNDFVMA